MSNKVKRKVLTQRHVSSRMNFLYQAANLMAHNNHNSLAAFYGKLCRNVGTKALMHMSPSLKRTLCKRCSLPLLPGINTTLMLEQQQHKPQEQMQQQQHKPREQIQRQQHKPQEQIQQQQHKPQEQIHQQQHNLQEKQQPKQMDKTTVTSKKRHRRLRRGKRRKEAAVARDPVTANTAIDDKAQLQLECSLCRAQRRFHIDTQSECWPERPEAIVQTVTLE